MILSALGIGFGLMITFIIVVGLFIYYTINQKIKRVSRTDISKIKRGYFHHSFILPSPLDTGVRKKLLSYLDSHQAKIITGDNNEIIAYINGFEKSFFQGPQIEYKKFPLRIIISEQNKELYIQLDESRGIKKLAPEVAEMYTKKYDQLFNFHTDQITATLQA